MYYLFNSDCFFIAGSKIFVKKYPARIPPTSGARIYTQKNPPLESGNAALPQPNIHATKRGAKSRVGFIPACVIDAKSARSDPTVNPIKIGAVLSFGLPTFAPSVNKKLISTHKNVPNASTAIASGIEIVYPPGWL